MTNSEEKLGWKVKLLAVSVVFNFLLSLGMFVNTHKVESIQTKLVDTQKQICVDSNEGNLNQHKLWEGIITLTSQDQVPDPAKVAGLRTLLDETFPQRLCK